MANKKVLIGGLSAEGIPSGQPWTPGDTATDPDGNVLGIASASSPAGSVTMYAGSSVPSGWLDCDGSLKVRTAEPTLFAAIGTTWNVGGEAGTDFRLPDLRGRSPVGVGTGGGLSARALAASGGEEAHQLSTAELASHVHSEIGQAFSPTYNDSFGISAGPFTATVSTGSAGSNATHNTMHPFRGVYFIIKK